MLQAAGPYAGYQDTAESNQRFVQYMLRYEPERLIKLMVEGVKKDLKAFIIRQGQPLSDRLPLLITFNCVIDTPRQFRNALEGKILQELGSFKRLGTRNVDYVCSQISRAVAAIPLPVEAEEMEEAWVSPLAGN